MMSGKYTWRRDNKFAAKHVIPVVLQRYVRGNKLVPESFKGLFDSSPRFEVAPGVKVQVNKPVVALTFSPGTFSESKIC